MKKINNTKDWKDVLDYLMTIESFSKLKEMRKSIFEQRGFLEPMSSEAMLAKKDLAHSESLSDKEILAISVYDLIGNNAEKTDDGKIVFFGYTINPEKLQDNVFLDSLKMVDLMATGSFPTQIADFERNWGYSNVLRAAREGKIQLSISEVSLIHNDGLWKISGIKEPSEDLLKSLEHFNDVFYQSVNDIIDRSIEKYSEMSID